MLWLGHGSYRSVGRHCESPFAAMIDSDRIAGLTNPGELPYLVTAACIAGAFDWVDASGRFPPHSFAEVTLLEAARGAVATSSNTTTISLAFP